MQKMGVKVGKGIPLKILLGLLTERSISSLPKIGGIADRPIVQEDVFDKRTTHA